jgi:tetratricopeptide (TPR) repeat protein
MLNDRQSAYLPLAGGLLLVVVTLALYSPVRNHPFINYDDDRYVTQNAHVKAGLNWNTFLWTLTATEQSNWHPLTWLSHVLDFEIYGSNAGGHHVSSVLIHLLNVVLLFLLLLRSTHAMGRSLVVAALFALHPLNVESVAWVAERKNVLSTLFFLLALAAYGWYAQKPGVKRYLLLVAMFVFGLSSKPMVITLPFVLLLLDFWPLERIEEAGPAAPVRVSKAGKQRAAQALAPKSLLVTRHSPLWTLVLEKVPLLILSAASALITIVAQRSSAIRSLEGFPLQVRLENALYSYAMYVWKAFWPARLALFYPYPGRTLAGWQLGLAALFFAGVSALAWNQRFDRRYLLTGWLWYLGILVPVIGLMQVGDQAMADRYAYIPLIGVFVMVVWGVADWADSRRINFTRRAAVTVALLAFFSFFTWKQIGYWKSSYDVWLHTLEVTQRNAIAEGNLGDALHSTGQPEDALPHFRNAVALQPRDAKQHANLAEDLAECGRLQDAVAEYEIVTQLISDPHALARTFVSLAILDGALEDYSGMRENYRQALQIDPQSGPATINSLSRGIAANPVGQGYLQLGVLLEEAGHATEARAAYEQAVTLDPSLAEAIKSLHQKRDGK